MKHLSELLDLKGKAAIVTGGAKGIGYGIAYRLAEAGAAVLIADMDEAAATKAAKGLEAKGWKASAIKCDVSDEEQVKSMVQDCRKQFGSVDILVNNAGIYPQEPVADMTQDEFEKVMDVNLRSVFLTTKHASESHERPERRKDNQHNIHRRHTSVHGGPGSLRCFQAWRMGIHYEYCPGAGGA